MITFREAEPTEKSHSLFSSESSTSLIHLRPESVTELIFELIADMDWIELSACKRGHNKDSAKPTLLRIVDETVAHTANRIWTGACGGRAGNLNE